MPRKGSVPKRDVLPDPIHNSKLVTKLINKIMLDGKRGTAQRILYSAFDLVEQRSGRDALEVFEEAINNIMPVLEVKARRVGGSNYQVPVEVRPERRTTLGLRWLVNYARLRGEKTMEDRLLTKFLMLLTTLVALLKNVKTFIKWQKQTKHSHTIVGKVEYNSLSMFHHMGHYIWRYA